MSYKKKDFVNKYGIDKYKVSIMHGLYKHFNYLEVFIC